MFEEAAEISLIEFLGGCKLPEQGTQMLAEFEQSGIKETLDGVAGFRKYAPVHRITRSLYGKDEAVRHLDCPFAKGRRRLRAVEGAVDFDRGKVAACICEFLRLRQPVGIKYAAPGLVGPTPDADTDFCRCINCHCGCALKKA